MKHAIVGAGGIGGLLAVALGAAGEEVTVVVRPGTLSDYPEQFTLESATLGQLSARVMASERLADSVDVLWMATKAGQLEAAIAGLDPGLVEHGLVIPLLNGVEHMARLRERFPRVLAATISVESEKVAPGRYRQPSGFAVCEFAPAVGAEAGHAAAAQAALGRAGLTCRTGASEVDVLWAKLCFLAPLALCTSVAGGPVEAVRADPGLAARWEAAIREAVAVARALGAEIAVERVLERARGLPGTMRSSMQKDLAAGRRTEIDAIGGAILRAGQGAGVETPVLVGLVEEVRAAEARAAGIFGGS